MLCKGHDEKDLCFLVETSNRWNFGVQRVFVCCVLRLCVYVQVLTNQQSWAVVHPEVYPKTSVSSLCLCLYLCLCGGGSGGGGDGGGVDPGWVSPGCSPSG